MTLHYIFLSLYFLLFLFVSSKVMCMLLMLHALLIMHSYYKEKKPVDPLLVYCVYILSSSVANIAMIGRAETNTVSYFYAYLIPDKISASVMVWCMGNAFIFMGYQLFLKNSFPPIDINVKEKSLKKLFYVMILMSLKKYIYTDVFSGSLSTILLVFALVGIVFFARLWTKYDNKTYRNYALILFALQTIAALLYTILRTDILMPTVALFTGYFLGKGSIKEILSYRVLPFVGVLLIFNSYFALFGANRTQIGTGFQRLTDLQTIDAYQVYYEEEEKENVLERASILPQLTNVVNLVDTRGFFNGDATAPLLIALIPRFLWPEKPLIGLGAWFATEIGMGIQTDSWYNNSINMTIPGHLYLDFGWVGVVIGCILVGGLLASLWNATNFYKSPYNITGITMGGYLMLQSLQGIGADLQIIITLASFYLIFLFIKKVFG